ncbi:MAG: hypothetical protein DRJ03_24465 [Chloroflexi bacterium]|nr:MAG: hypothetical protein DRJ03_24465 [Chloroflexota bacterium]
MAINKKIVISTLPGIKLEKPKNLTPEHFELLCFFVNLIYNNISQIINYDHVDLPFPKSPIPLKWQGKYADISFKTGNKIVFINIDVVDQDKV